MLPEYVIQQILSAVESGDIETTSIYLASDFIFRGPTTMPLNKEQFLQMLDALLVAVPNIAFHVTDFNEKNGAVSVKTKITGTNTGEISLPYTDVARMPPTGKRVHMPEVTMRFTVRRDKVVSAEVAPVPRVNIPQMLRRLSQGQPVRVGA